MKIINTVKIQELKKSPKYFILWVVLNLLLWLGGIFYATIGILSYFAPAWGSIGSHDLNVLSPTLIIVGLSALVVGVFFFRLDDRLMKMIWLLPGAGIIYAVGQAISFFQEPDRSPAFLAGDLASIIAPLVVMTIFNLLVYSTMRQFQKLSHAPL